MRLTPARILVPALALAIAVAAVASPNVLGIHFARALDAVGGANRGWLTVAMIGFAAGFVSCVCAWRAALEASGSRISVPRGTACLGLGAAVNSFAPARLGDVVKLGLFSRTIDGPDRLWTAGGVFAAVSAAHCLSVAVLVVAASATGALPLWPVLVMLAVVATVAALAFSSPRWRRFHRLAHLLEGFAALERSPRLAARVLGWSAAVSLARLGAVAALAAAFGLPHPLLAALVICPALDLAAAIPLTPGNIGVASGAVAVALQSPGIGMTQALAVGIGIQALETMISLSAGAFGALYFFRPRGVAGRWAVRLAAIGASAGVAAMLSVLVLNAV
jgi:uncharacterized membrane protein YbhN (UPF0104 family)